MRYGLSRAPAPTSCRLFPFETKCCLSRNKNFTLPERPHEIHIAVIVVEFNRLIVKTMRSNHSAGKYMDILAVIGDIYAEHFFGCDACMKTEKQTFSFEASILYPYKACPTVQIKQYNSQNRKHAPRNCTPDTCKCGAVCVHTAYKQSNSRTDQTKENKRNDEVYYQPFF